MKKIWLRIKNWFMKGTINNWIADLVDLLKVKQPKIFGAIAAVLIFLKAGIGEDSVLSLSWILEKIGLSGYEVPFVGGTIEEWFLYLTALFVTTSTTAYVTNKTKKERRIERSKRVSATEDRKLGFGLPPAQTTM